MLPDVGITVDGSLYTQNVSYESSTHTLTLNGATIDGTLQITGESNHDTGQQSITYFNIVLGSGTSYISSLKLNSAVIVTVTGDGELVLRNLAGHQGDQSTGASVEFQQDPQTLAPELIIEGGTVTIDGGDYDYAIKEEGCLYIREGAKKVTLIRGLTGIILDAEEYGIPKIFSDYPCLAKYISSYNGGEEIVLSPNGTYNGSSDKGHTDTSLIEEDSNNYSQLTFKLGHTATWKNDDGSVLETDNYYYWDGQTPEYNGDTPTKTADAQYTYTFAGWSPEPAGITSDTTYTAVYSKTLNKYTITWKNADGTTLETDTGVEYGTTPKYDGEEPAKDADAQYTYTFAGWSPAVSAVTGDATYTATYTSTAIQNDKASTECNSEGSVAITDTTGTTLNVITESIAANGSEEMKKAISNAKKVEYKVVSAATSNEATGASNLQELINGKHYTFGAFLDLSIQVFADGTNVGNVTDLTGNIQLTVSIPETLMKDGRTFIIGRYHNGKTDVVGKGTGSTATIETDGFSTYAIAYYDEVDKVILLKGETKGSNKIKLTWNKISGATGYTLYGAKCGSKFKEIKTFSSSKNSYVAKKLKEGKSYKYYVVANGVKDASGDNVNSLSVHVMVGDGGKKGNPTKVTAKSKVTVKAGKKAKLGAKVVMEAAKTHIGNGHCDSIRYISSDESIATVTKNGKVKGIKSGSCKVYAVASNGISKRINVTVK
ncbi:MAG: Ig-like domain-containing protein [Butyrivibrio sp.]|nr:Ig-like domain-containing protein [Butyrivibrio sp.]